MHLPSRQPNPFLQTHVPSLFSMLLGMWSQFQSSSSTISWSRSLSTSSLLSSENLSFILSIRLGLLFPIVDVCYFVSISVCEGTCVGICVLCHLNRCLRWLMMNLMMIRQHNGILVSQPNISHIIWSIMLNPDSKMNAPRSNVMQIVFLPFIFNLIL